MIMEWDEITAGNKASRRGRTDYICFGSGSGKARPGPSIGLSSMTGWMDFGRYMEATPAEQAKARRTLILLYALMIVGVGLPFVVYYFLR
jgi:hypothetical protein